ncbi:NDP-sugar synthase [Candidatus Amarobacter glycogenicus]|uniref:NDP-sugar synthase n=1 Tax=Candidatus Amarobacter glycogenicus TaxID=3140699 RepID=UPI003134B39C|nr:NDP-sugar synthase [Dehalococcoidia bacterium]
MDAILLVGGQGTRLRPLTSHRHKSLVPLLNRPAIEYLFEWLERSGFDRVVLALGQANEDLATAYPAGQRGRLEIIPILERERLESGGAIRNAVKTAGIAGRFAVLNGDVYVDFDFAPALAAHIEREADLTMALKALPDPSQFGVAVTDGTGLITGFVEKPPPGTAPSNLVNAGVWIFEPGLVDEIPSGAVRVEETLFPSLVARRRTVLGHQFSGTWADLGTPARYLQVSKELLGTRNEIAPGVKLSATGSLSGSAIGMSSQLQMGTTVQNSILWENVTVSAGAQVIDSILADNVFVGTGAVLQGVVAGRGAQIGAGVVLPPGTSVEAGGRYD